MTKQELTNNGFKYISTHNCGQKTELWAKFTGYLDTIQYIYYLPNVDKTIPNNANTTSYLQIDMFAQIRDKMRNDFLKYDIQYDKEGTWSDDSIK
jgi:hypothetical protein